MVLSLRYALEGARGVPFFPTPIECRRWGHGVYDIAVGLLRGRSCFHFGVLFVGMNTYCKVIVSDFRIPAGYVVSQQALPRGYQGYGPDRWYEAYEGQRKIGEYDDEDDAIEACRKDAKKNGWAKSRYEIIAADDEEPVPPPENVCGGCGRTEHEDGSRVTWKCHICGKTICRDCTLTIPGSHPPEYFFQTLCSRACWTKAGGPDE